MEKPGHSFKVPLNPEHSMQDNTEIQTLVLEEKRCQNLPPKEKLLPFGKTHDAVVVWFPSQDRTHPSRFGHVEIRSSAPLPFPLRPIGNIRTPRFFSLPD